MKKLFTLVVMMCLLGINRTWAADELWFDFGDGIHNVKEITGSTSFQSVYFPDLVYGDNINLNNDDNFQWSFEFSGITVKLGETEINSNPSSFSDRGSLFQQGDNPTAIQIKGTEGYLLVTARQKNAVINGVKYIARFLIRVKNPAYKYYWNFNDHTLVAGKMEESGYRSRLSQQKINNGSDPAWGGKDDSGVEGIYQYLGYPGNNNIPNNIEEARGLAFNNVFFDNHYSAVGLTNDVSSLSGSGPAEWRSIALSKGSSVTINNVAVGDHICIAMGKHSDGVGNLKLEFTNLSDATGKPITSANGEYLVGGTPWILNDQRTQDPTKGGNYNGDYQFIATGTTVTIKLSESSDAQWLRLYRIAVYDGDFIQTNEILSPKKIDYAMTSQFGVSYNHYNGDDFLKPNSNDNTIEYYLHNRGQAERYFKVGKVICTGTLDLKASDFTLIEETINGLKYKKKVHLDPAKFTSKFGAFKLGLMVTSCRSDGQFAEGPYVTDYAERIMSVGYYEGVSHPYTWDFSDLKRFSSSLFENDYNGYHESEYNGIYNNDNVTLKDVEDMNNWAKQDGDYVFSYTRSKPSGAPFAWGSQLYAFDQMIPESRGIAFYPHHMGNNSIKLTSEGLRIEGGSLSSEDVNALTTPNITGGQYGTGTSQKAAIWENPEGSTARTGWEMVIPNVPNLTATYIRVQTISGKDPKLTFNFSLAGGNGDKWSFFKKTIPNSDGTNDIIVGISPNQTGNDKGDALHIYANNVIVKKIATSKDIKPAFGKTGYLTESRHREIDHRLSGFFTGEDIKAYYGTLGQDAEGNKVVVLHEVKIMDKADANYSGDGVGLDQSKASADIAGKGCILYHPNGTEEGEFVNRSFNILDGGFHLFVPDMHDMDATTGEDDLGGPDNISGNILWARYYNANVWNWGTTIGIEVPGIAETNGDDINYILSASHYNYHDELEKGNGYDVGFYHVASKGASMPVHASYIRMSKEDSQSLSKVLVSFDDLGFAFDDVQGIATKIDNVNVNSDKETTGYYTLSGVAVSKPSQKGLYIKNGKKVIVK